MELMRNIFKYKFNIRVQFARNVMEVKKADNNKAKFGIQEEKLS